MSHTIFLALGTNLGDRFANLKAAQEALPPKVQVGCLSPIYETLPWGYAEQPNFLNQVLQASTTLRPAGLLKYLKTLEKRLGRTPAVRYGPRLIDIDILFYDELVLQTPALTIPHPRLHERAFILVPLAALAPELVHPSLGCSIKSLLEKADTSSIIKMYDIM